MDKSPAEMVRILPDEDFILAIDFIGLGEELKCKSQVRFAPAHKTWKCVYSRKKPSRVLFTVECTEKKWHVKANLWNIDAYREVLDECSDRIKDAIKNAYNCKSCNEHCKGGVGFTFEKKLYSKCIGCCFYFSSLSKDEWRSLLHLIEMEYGASNSAVASPKS